MEIPGHLDDSCLRVGSEEDMHNSDGQTLKSDEPDTMGKPLQTGDKTSAVHQSDVTRKSTEEESHSKSQLPKCNENKTDTNNNCISKQKCHLCDYATNFKSLMAKHRRQQHKEYNDQYRCETCNKGFPERYLLRNHVDAKHKGIKWICEFCAKSYEGKGALEVHKRKCHINDAIYKCKTCHKSFMDKHLYIGHVSKHDGKKLFTCEKCKKSFRYKNSLKMHQKSCHGNASFLCAQCGMQFTCSKGLKDHINGKHKMEKQFSCECGNSYRWRSSLSFHRKKCVCSK